MGKNNNDNNFVKEITNIEDDFAKWYTDIVLKAELADYTDTKGCIAIKPYGYSIWENIQKYMDERFKQTGVENVYFPVLISENLLKKEEDHIEGFAPEVAWVTNAGGEDLDEKYCIRPTSETMFSTLYSKWLNSWRDLPMVYNQWCNVLRWEKETRPFLRSREFLWQEGHTIHETAEEAKARTIQMLEIYAETIENLLAIPVLKGIKTEKEKFAGAEETYTVECLMHDGRALQSATSHYFGQNFTKPFNVKFQNREGKEEYAYQTSWGATTRLIGAIIMAHGDNRGLKLPPKVAPIQVVIIPIAGHKEGVLEKSNELFESLKKDFRVKLDDRDNYSTGFKFNDWEMRGVPIRVEIGPRDIENGVAVVVRRDNGEKETVEISKLNDRIKELLEEIHNNMFNECLKNREVRTTVAYSLDEILKNLNTNQGYVKTMWCESLECENKVKEITGAHSRCIPFEQENLDNKCAICGKTAKKMIVWGRQY
ncbi:MAG: proline--tRNA ligase [Clostridia bacterium]|nr:proline--tRNA ligase [Clostridia bacterium]